MTPLTMGGENRCSKRRNVLHGAERPVADCMVRVGARKFIYKSCASRRIMTRTVPSLKSLPTNIMKNREEQSPGRIPCKILLFDQGQVALEQKISVLPDEKTRIQLGIQDKKSWSPEHPFYTSFASCMGRIWWKLFWYAPFTAEPDSSGIQGCASITCPISKKGHLRSRLLSRKPPDACERRAMIHDIKTAKAKGFNMIRKHCKIEPMRWYYHCDRLGMLVWQDMINGGTSYNLIKTCYIPTVLFPLRHKRDNDYSYTSKGGQGWQGGMEEGMHRDCQAALQLRFNLYMGAV